MLKKNKYVKKNCMSGLRYEKKVPLCVSIRALPTLKTNCNDLILNTRSLFLIVVHTCKYKTYQSLLHIPEKMKKVMLLGFKRANISKTAA